MSNIEELKILKELLDDRVITREEFEAQKKKMLSDTSGTEKGILLQGA